MIIRYVISAIFFLCLVGALPAQKSLLKKANKLFEAEKFYEAVDLYVQVQAKDFSDKDLYRKGLAHLHSNQPDQAILDLTNAHQLGYDEKEIYYYAGKAYHSKNLFAEASRFYKNYLRYIEDEKEIDKTIRLIKQCKFGIDNKFNDQIAFVENLGDSVNTRYDELNPVQSPTTHNKYYFSSNRAGSNGGLRNEQGYKDEENGQYSADMYAVEVNDGNWTSATAFHPILNGPKNELIQGFNPDGSVMYFLKSQDGITGEIYSDTFSIDKDLEVFPQQFKSPMITELGDKDLQVFNDQTLLFASKRIGGFGGYDLYISIQKNGKWQAPMNLGPAINTKYDEISPFLSKSGKRLYFSTNRLESLGGYDIYETVYSTATSTWSAAKNLSLPINSTQDDVDFSLSSDGMTAILSSNRLESIGGFDLYLAYLKDQATDQLMYTEAIPFIQSEGEGNDSTIVSTAVNSTKEEEEETIDQKEFYNSTLYYGSDEIILHPANVGKLARLKDLLIIFPSLSVVLTGHSTREGMREFDLYFSIKRAEKVAEYLIDNGIDKDRIYVKGVGYNFPHTTISTGQASSLVNKNNKRIDVDFLNINPKRLKIIEENPLAFEGMIDPSYTFYTETTKNLFYKVRIAETKQMYKGDVIRQYPTGIIEKNMSDNLYSYTLGLFRTYREAKELKDALTQKNGIQATVIPYFNDEPISSDRLDQMIDSYPDLKAYKEAEF